MATLRSSTALLIFVLGLIIGANLPDFDQQFQPFIQHRSLITHGWIIPAILLIFASVSRNRADWYALVAGMCVGLAAHLSFDLFPARWVGTALITLPFVNTRTDGTFSWLWIASSIVICLAIVAVIIPRRDYGYITTGAVAAFAWCAPGERSFWGAALVLGIAMLIALWGPGLLLQQPAMRGRHV
jgi:hypothetical protein